MSTAVSKMIDAEYDAYCLDGTRDINKMYELLYDYVRSIIASRIKKGSYIDHETVSELTQDVMLVIATDKIHTFEKQTAAFSTFCATIAKNKALDYVKKRNRHTIISYEKVENDVTDENGKEIYREFENSGREIYKNPEMLLIRYEQQLEYIERLKEYLQLLMNQDTKPYRTASCCYSMVLFHRYHPDAKVLGSPKWAYEELKEDTVEESADRYHKEINEWFPRYNLYWGNAFLDGMDEKEAGGYVGDMIYGEHFELGDFENWNLRMRRKIKEEMFEQAQNALE